MPVMYSQQIAVQQQITGPLPPPDVLGKYEGVQKGLVDRIVTLAEGEAGHRRQIETTIIATQARDQRAYRRAELFGQVFGLIIGITAIVGAVYSGTHGAQITGSFIGTTGVVGLVSAFILGRSSLLKFRQQDIDQQAQMLKEQHAQQLGK